MSTNYGRGRSKQGKIHLRFRESRFTPLCGKGSTTVGPENLPLVSCKVCLRIQQAQQAQQAPQRAALLILNALNTNLRMVGLLRDAYGYFHINLPGAAITKQIGELLGDIEFKAAVGPPA